MQRKLKNEVWSFDKRNLASPKEIISRVIFGCGCVLYLVIVWVLIIIGLITVYNLWVEVF